MHGRIPGSREEPGYCDSGSHTKQRLEPRPWAMSRSGYYAHHHFLFGCQAMCAGKYVGCGQVRSATPGSRSKHAARRLVSARSTALAAFSIAVHHLVSTLPLSSRFRHVGRGGWQNPRRISGIIRGCHVLSSSNAFVSSDDTLGSACSCGQFARNGLAEF